MTPVAVSLPADLAPALRDAACKLVAEVGLAAPHPDPMLGGAPAPYCWVCRQRGGRMGGHHEGRTVVWVHKSCHRKLHRRRTRTGRHSR